MHGGAEAMSVNITTCIEMTILAALVDSVVRVPLVGVSASADIQRFKPTVPCAGVPGQSRAILYQVLSDE